MEKMVVWVLMSGARIVFSEYNPSLSTEIVGTGTPALDVAGPLFPLVHVTHVPLAGGTEDADDHST